MALATDPNPDSGKLSPTARRMLELRDEVRLKAVKRARQTRREAEHLSHPVLINTFPSLYGNIAEAITLGCPRATGDESDALAIEHDDERERLTNNVHSVISEYQILRWAIVDVLK
jgi:hypothetical protein